MGALGGVVFDSLRSLRLISFPYPIAVKTSALAWVCWVGWCASWSPPLFTKGLLVLARLAAACNSTVPNLQPVSQPASHPATLPTPRRRAYGRPPTTTTTRRIRRKWEWAVMSGAWGERGELCSVVSWMLSRPNATLCRLAWSAGRRSRKDCGIHPSILPSIRPSPLHPSVQPVARPFALSRRQIERSSRAKPCQTCPSLCLLC